MNGASIISYIILTLAIAYSFTYPAWQDIQTLVNDKSSLSKSLENARNIETKKAELLAKYQNISPELKKEIDTVIPSSFQFVRLVSQIDALGNDYGISIDKITSMEKNQSSGDSIDTATPTKIYKSAIVGFSFDATYPNFQKFMNDLEKSLRILDVKSVKVDAKSNNINNYMVEFETYWLE